MFQGYLIGRREIVAEDNGGISTTVYTKPAILSTLGYEVRRRSHSQRVKYTLGESPDMEVFYIEIEDADVMTVRNDPNTYMLNLDWSDFEPQPVANWMKTQGENRPSFQTARGRYQQTDATFNSKLDEIEAFLSPFEFNTRADLYTAFGSTQFPTVNAEDVALTGNTGQALYVQIIGDTALAGGTDDLYNMTKNAVEVVITDAGALDGGVGDASHFQVGATDLSGTPYAYGARIYNTGGQAKLRAFAGVSQVEINLPSNPADGDRIGFYTNAGNLYATAKIGATWYVTGAQALSQGVTESLLYVQTSADGATSMAMAGGDDTAFDYSSYPGGMKSFLGDVI